MSDNLDQIREWFREFDDDFLKFDKIPPADRRHPRPDICAFIYLHEKLGGQHDIVGSAEHDEIWLSFDWDAICKLAKEDVQYIVQCGVRYDSEADALAMFV